MAPVTRLKNIKSKIRHLAGVTPVAEMGQWLLGGAELLPSTPTGRWLAAQELGLKVTLLFLDKNDFASTDYLTVIG